jgi:glycosyltransferase involved in cell wall biosynthesis
MMSVPDRKMVFVSMSDKANGAEGVLLMAAQVSCAPVIFLKKEAKGGLEITGNQSLSYISATSMVMGFLKLGSFLKPYRAGYVIMSTHPYLNAYLGFLKRIGYLKSQLIVRECTTVFTRYAGFKKWRYQLAYWLGYRGVDLVVCQTGDMRKDFLKHITFISPKNVVVLENPIDLATISLKAKSPLNDPDANTDFICAAGRLIPEKGFSTLIQAFSFVEKQYPNLKLLIFGDGPEKQSLVKLIAMYGLQQRVILKGWTNNPMPYFKRAKVCVVSSVIEGFPNVLLQMMVLNRAVVSTLCAGGIDNIPGILKARVNSGSSLAAMLRAALNPDTDNETSVVRKYLRRRTPQLFVKTLLKTLK